ncbi:hypothetical protein DFH11DRAFT_1233758 [Phellopilus nigrolimitatus]|nr:hypothetical protein DFH11DRAFT_1233758 [Phellopilus nigrolimitatus]
MWEMVMDDIPEEDTEDVFLRARSGSMSAKSVLASGSSSQEFGNRRQLQMCVSPQNDKKHQRRATMFKALANSLGLKRAEGGGGGDDGDAGSLKSSTKTSASGSRKALSARRTSAPSPLQPPPQQPPTHTPVIRSPRTPSHTARSRPCLLRSEPFAFSCGSDGAGDTSLAESVASLDRPVPGVGAARADINLDLDGGVGGTIRLITSTSTHNDVGGPGIMSPPRLASVHPRSTSSRPHPAAARCANGRCRPSAARARCGRALTPKWMRT